MGYRDHEDALRARAEALKTRLQGLDQDAEATRAELAQAESELAALEDPAQQKASPLLMSASVAMAILATIELVEALSFVNTLGWIRLKAVAEAICFGLVAWSFFRTRFRLAVVTGSLYALAAINMALSASATAANPLDFAFGRTAITIAWLVLCIMTALIIWQARQLPRWSRLSASMISCLAALIAGTSRFHPFGLDTLTLYRLDHGCVGLMFLGLAAFFWYSRFSPQLEPADENVSLSETAHGNN